MPCKICLLLKKFSSGSLCQIKPLTEVITKIRSALGYCFMWALISVMPLTLGFTLRIFKSERMFSMCWTSLESHDMNVKPQQCDYHPLLPTQAPMPLLFDHLQPTIPWQQNWSPDFKHKKMQNALWLVNWQNPIWVWAKVAAMAPGSVQLNIFHGIEGL